MTSTRHQKGFNLGEQKIEIFKGGVRLRKEKHHTIRRWPDEVEKVSLGTKRSRRIQGKNEKKKRKTCFQKESKDTFFEARIGEVETARPDTLNRRRTKGWDRAGLCYKADQEKDEPREKERSPNLKTLGRSSVGICQSKKMEKSDPNEKNGKLKRSEGGQKRGPEVRGNSGRGMRVYVGRIVKAGKEKVKYLMEGAGEGRKKKVGQRLGACFLLPKEVGVTQKINKIQGRGGGRHANLH